SGFRCNRNPIPRPTRNLVRPGTSVDWSAGVCPPPGTGARRTRLSQGGYQGFAGLDRFFHDRRQVGLLGQLRVTGVRHAFRPDVKAAPVEAADLPHAPDALSLVEAPVE